jgi:hypothetical protein
VIRGAQVLAVLVALAALPRGTRAQSGAIGADAEVIGVGTSIATLRTLDFGQVTKGIATTVQPTAAGAGEWQVQGNANAFVLITFTLPTQLTNIQALPGSTMPILFNNTAARWRATTNDPAGAATFNPNTIGLARFPAGAAPTIYVWIGGTVSPAAAAKPGVYVGNVIVSLDYLF